MNYMSTITTVVILCVTQAHNIFDMQYVKICVSCIVI